MTVMHVHATAPRPARTLSLRLTPKCCAFV